MYSDKNMTFSISECPVGGVCVRGNLYFRSNGKPLSRVITKFPTCLDILNKSLF
jgi:hypothetical protein